MQLGMVGLGRMGSNIVLRLMRGGHACVSFDLNPKNVKALANEGSQGATSLDDFLGKEITSCKTISLNNTVREP